MASRNPDHILLYYRPFHRYSWWIFPKLFCLWLFFGHDRKMRSTRIHCFRNPQKRTEALYQGAEVLFCFDCIPLTPCTGRAVVRVEPYDPPMMGKGGSKNKPLLAMRVLELLTPVKQLSQDNYMQPPVAGELVTVNYRSEGLYEPWVFGSRASTHKAFNDFINSSTT